MPALWITVSAPNVGFERASSETQMFPVRTGFRAVAWSEYIGNILLGGGWALPILFGLAGKLPWVYAIGLAAIVVVLGVWLWPYVTIFEKVIAKGKGTENA
jgi:hypothetical protein